MKKIEEIITKTLDTNEGKCVDVFAYVDDDTLGEVTLGYSVCGNEEIVVMSYGRINTEDPSDVPSRTFEDWQEAAESEYGEAFETMRSEAEKILSGQSAGA